MHGRCTRAALPYCSDIFDRCWLNFQGKENEKENEKNIMMLLNAQASQSTHVVAEKEGQGSNFESWIEQSWHH